MQVDLDPAGGLLDALAGVVRSPALDKAHPEDTQPPQVVYADARCCRQTWEEGERRGGVGYVELLKANSKDYPSVLVQNKILNGI